MQKKMALCLCLLAVLLTGILGMTAAQGESSGTDPIVLPEFDFCYEPKLSVHDTGFPMADIIALFPAKVPASYADGVLTAEDIGCASMAVKMWSSSAGSNVTTYMTLENGVWTCNVDAADYSDEWNIICYGENNAWTAEYPMHGDWLAKIEVQLPSGGYVTMIDVNTTNLYSSDMYFYYDYGEYSLKDEYGTPHGMAMAFTTTKGAVSATYYAGMTEDASAPGGYAATIPEELSNAEVYVDGMWYWYSGTAEWGSNAPAGYETYDAGNFMREAPCQLSGWVMPGVLTITQQPQDVTAAEGEAAIVSVIAEGNGLIYNWYYKPTTQTWFWNAGESDSNSYTVTMDSSWDGCQLFCRVKDKYGDILTTDTVTIHLGEAVDPEPTTDLTYTIADGAVTITGYTGSDMIVVLPSEIEGSPVTTIAAGAFPNALTRVTIPASVTAIEDGAFDTSSASTIMKVEHGSYAYTWCWENAIPFKAGLSAAAVELPAVSTLTATYLSLEKAGFVKEDVLAVLPSLPKIVIANGRVMMADIGAKNVGYCYLSNGHSHSFTRMGDVWIAAADPAYEFTSEGFFDFQEINNTSDNTSLSLAYNWNRKDNAMMRYSISEPSGSSIEVSIDLYVNATYLLDDTYRIYDYYDYTTGALKEEEVRKWAEYNVTAYYDNTGSLTEFEVYPSSGGYASTYDPDTGKWIYGGTGEECAAPAGYEAVDAAWVFENYPPQVPGAVKPDPEPAPTLSYTYTIENGEVTITGYTGTETKIEIPAEIEGYPVTTIGSAAFMCSTLTSVTIPSSVATVASDAFTGSEALEEVVFSEGLTSIDSFAFAHCYALNSVNLPSTLTRIGELAFSYDRSLTSIVIPEGITELASELFTSCTNLTSVTIPESVTTIGASFLDCASLTTVTIPAGVTSMHESAFNGCSADLVLRVDENSYAHTWCEENGQAYELIMDSSELAITVQPQSVTVPEGEKAVVTFTVEGDDLTYAWYFKDKTATKFYLTTSFTSNTYTVEMTEARDGRQLYCVVTDQLGNTVQTETVTISMEKTQTELAITQQPQSVTVAEGEKATVTFTAEGDGLTYAWYFKDLTHTKFYLTTSFTGNTYTVEMTEARDGRQLYCVVTDQYGNTVQTETVTISMEAVVPASPYTYTIENGEVTITGYTGTDTELIVPAEIEGYPVTKIDEYALDESSFTRVVVPSTVKEIGMAVFGYSNVETVVLPSGLETLGRYAFLECWNLKNVNIPSTLKVIEEATFMSCGALTSIEIPEGVEHIGDMVFDGCRSLTSVKIPASVTQIGYDLFMGCPESLTVTVYENSYAHTWCVENEIAYELIKTATELAITVQPQSVTVKEGEKATVTFTAEGDGLTYAWYYKDKTATKFYLTTSFTSNTYSVAMTEARDGRQLYCVVTDQYGNTVQTDTVTISMEIPKTELKITKQPSSVKVAEGETAKVTFTAQGDGLTYAWYYKDKTAAKFYLTTSFASNTYSVAMTEARDGRQLYCVVTDEYGNTVQTDTVTISMEIPKTELKITKQPAGVTVAEGEAAKVSFTAQGDGLTYAWYFKNKGASSFSKTNSFTGNTYSVTMDSTRDGRQIYCVVTDQYGSTVQTDTVTISMEIPKTELKITQQPVSVTVQEGGTAKANVVAQGDGLTYTWYLKDPSGTKFSKSSITSATYSVAMTSAKSGRQVYCVVTDQYGSTVTTNTVTLTMATKLAITAQPVSVTVADGETAKVSVTAQGDGLSYLWYIKDSGATAVTSASYSVEMSSAVDGCQVYCVVTDKYGNTVTSDVATLTMEVKKTELKITKQPADVTVAEGANAKVTLTAQGDGLTYAWYFRNAGASSFSLTTTFTGNSYTVTMDSTRAGRQVYCVVTDQYGNQVTSNTVTLNME